MVEKVVRLHQALERHRIPHAFGGAIAVDYYRVPRATIDIDLNVFIPPDQHWRVVDAFGELFEVSNADALADEVAVRDQGMTSWGQTRIDLFFAARGHPDSDSLRRGHRDHQGGVRPCSGLGGHRGGCKLMGRDLDLEYMTGWLDRIIGSDDPRVERLRKLVATG